MTTQNPYQKMQLPIKQFIFFLLLFTALGGGFSGCKNQKKIAEQQAAEARIQKIQKAKTDLQALLAAGNNMSVEDKKSRLAQIKALNLSDPEINRLIAEVERAIATQESQEAKAVAEEQAKREAERKKKQMSEEAEKKAPTIYDYFEQIVGSNTTPGANNLIKSALDLFASPEIPVLIVVYDDGDVTDYDEPTTIVKYLNYLKDQEKDLNEIKDIKFNAAGKITELELKRKGI